MTRRPASRRTGAASAYATSAYATGLLHQRQEPKAGVPAAITAVGMVLPAGWILLEGRVVRRPRARGVGASHGAGIRTATGRPSLAPSKNTSTLSVPDVTSSGRMASGLCPASRMWGDRSASGFTPPVVPSHQEMA